MKIGITADLHYGVPGKLKDILWACRVIREYCRIAKIDVVVILGDLFHDRRSLEIDILCAVTEFFEETSTVFNQQWIVFPGNHDMFLRHSWATNSLVPLNRHLTVIQDVKLLTIDDKRFWVLPFIQQEKAYMRVLRKIETHYQEGDILLTHIGVRGATLNTCFLLKDWSAVTFEYSKFKKIYTGHFHSKQDLNKQVYYPGSPIPFKFDEGDISHGFYVHDLDDSTHKFVNIWKAGQQFFPNEPFPPQYMTILDENVYMKTEEEISGNMIRIAIQKDYTTDEQNNFKKHVESLGAVGVRWLDLAQRINRPPSSEQVAKAELNREDLFGSWLSVDQKGTSDLDIQVLRKTHDDVVQDGDELYSVEESEIMS